MRFTRCWCVLLACALAAPRLAATEPPDSNTRKLPSIRVSENGRGFVVAPSGKPFVPRGFNYDHDSQGRLLEEYWLDDWPAVERHFAQMRQLGANVVRVHLQFDKFLDESLAPNPRHVARLRDLLKLAESQDLYLDVTGLGCYHKAAVPAWYDALDEAERWEAQCRFWQIVAAEGRQSSAVFCYDLMNEPVVPGGRRAPGDWLGPPFAGKHFVQFVTLDQKERPRPQIARRWTSQLVRAIREVDPGTLVTVGLVDWSLDRPGLTSGFVPNEVAPEIDFVAVHLYPERGKLDAALDTLTAFSVGKPVVVEETFPLKCSPAELEQFMTRAGDRAAGWISFYWGQTPADLAKSKSIGDAIQRDWLQRFPGKGTQNPDRTESSP